LVGFASIYLSIILFAKDKLRKNGVCVAYESTRVIKALQEGLGGIRDVLIDGTQEAYCKIYAKADRPFRLAAGSNAFINSSPRYLIEALGTILIAVLAASLVGGNSEFVDSIPFLGALALGAQKSLPLMQQFYAAWSLIKGSQASVADAMILLDQPFPANIDLQNNAKLNFTKEIYSIQRHFLSTLILPIYYTQQQTQHLAQN
jgi:ATP-binding cassette subfamily B protein